MTNSVMRCSLLDAPSVANITLDLVEGMQINIGAFFTVTLPGQWTILIDAGGVVFEGVRVPRFSSLGPIPSR